MQQSTKAEAEAETTKVWRSVVGFGWCVSILYSVLLAGVVGWLVLCVIGGQNLVDVGVCCFK